MAKDQESLLSVELKGNYYFHSVLIFSQEIITPVVLFSREILTPGVLFSGSKNLRLHTRNQEKEGVKRFLKTRQITN